jgi:hypothetical protein
MTKARVSEVQRALNAFTTKHLAYIEPLRVDGDKGPSTNKRIRMAKYYLGYVKSMRTHGHGDDVDDQFLWRLRHPKRTNKRWKFKKRDVARGIKRRAAQRAHARKDRYTVRFRSGVTTYDGKPVAKWLVPKLNWARDHGGWHGSLNSGWRSPAYSRHLCYAICGRPSCPGRCAGTSSRHTKNAMPDGALDVNHYDEFGNAMHRAPASTGPRIYNNLPADPVHFSHWGN